MCSQLFAGSIGWKGWIIKLQFIWLSGDKGAIFYYEVPFNPRLIGLEKSDALLISYVCVCLCLCVHACVFFPSCKSSENLCLQWCCCPHEIHWSSHARELKKAFSSCNVRAEWLRLSQDTSVECCKESKSKHKHWALTCCDAESQNPTMNGHLMKFFPLYHQLIYTSIYHRFQSV